MSSASDVAAETFLRTDAAGTRRGVRVTWTPEPESEVVVRWHYRLDPAPWGPWSQSDRMAAPPFEILPAQPGRYELQVYSQTPTESVTDWGFYEVDVGPLGDSELELPKPSGLELVGPSGELLGSARTFTGRDLRVRWNAVRLDALYTDGVGEAPDDELLDLLELRVLGPTGVLLRTVPLPVTVTEWTYTYALNAEDQPLTTDPASAVRAVRFELRWKDRTGRLGSPAVLEVLHTLQLSATADLELGAVNEFLIVSDQTSVGLTAGLEVEQILESFTIDGPVDGAAVLLTAGDTLSDFDFTLGAALVLRYHLRIRLAAVPATILHERHFDALTFIDIGAGAVLTASAQPQLTMTIHAADLVPGDDLYIVELSFEQFDPVDGLSSSSAFVGLVSADRIITAQQVKR